MKKNKFEENFKEVRNQFDKDGGILEPVRCLVHHVNGEKDIFKEIAEMSANSGFDFEEYKNLSHVVGYFAAIKDPNGEVHIGLSICDPSDFDKKDSRISQLNAISSAKKFENQMPCSFIVFDEDEDMNEIQEFFKNAVEKMWVTKSHFGYINKIIRYSHVNQGNVIYNFAADKLCCQLGSFIERCQRYFFPAPKEEKTEE